MTIEQVKEEAKTRFQKDLTDEQAQAWLDAHPAGELQDEELENAAGGGCGGEKYPPENKKFGFPPCPSCGHKQCRGSRPDCNLGGMAIRVEYFCAKCGTHVGNLTPDHPLFPAGYYG